MTINKILKWCIIICLFLVPFTPYIVAGSLFFPFITGKVFFFRILVDIAFTLWLILALRDKEYRPKFTWLLGVITIFVGAMWFIDMFVAVNPFKAIWSNFERMEGWWTIAHLWMYFVVMSAFFTTREWWKRWFAMSLIVSAYITLVAGAQVIFNSEYYESRISPSLTSVVAKCENQQNVPLGPCLTMKFAIHQGSDRVDATLGNAAYLASYLLVHIFLAIYLMFHVDNWKKPRVWKWGLGILAILEFIILIYTGTRGSMIGFIGGIGLAALLLAIICRTPEERSVRKLGIGILIGLVVVLGVFISVRKTEYVQSHVVLARFANISIKDTKTQARAYIWPMALNGFKEKPILGWGQEGFNYVFNKYYDSRMYRQEQWFDRAHNVFLDWMVAGGIVGFGLYTSLYIFFLVYVWKSVSFTRAEKALFTGLIVAYAVHNFFIFDNTVSYIMFFALLAFIHGERVRQRSPLDLNRYERWAQKDMQVDIQNFVAIPLVVIIGLVVLYKVNLAPINASQTLIQALIPQREGPTKNIEYFKKAIAYDTTGKQEMREQLVTTAMQIINNQAAPIEIKNLFYAEARAEMEKQIEEAPYDARSRLFMSDFLTQVGRLDPSLYPEALAQAQKALELSPTKQSLMVNVVLGLLNVQKLDEALELATKTYALAPESESARDIYAVALVAKGRIQEASKMYPREVLPLTTEMVRALSASKQYTYLIKRYNELLDKTNDANNFQIYISLAAAYLTMKDTASGIRYVQLAAKANPAFKDQADAIIKDIRAGKDVLAQ